MVEVKSEDIPASSLEPAVVAMRWISGTSTINRSSSFRAVFSVSSIRVPRFNSTVTFSLPVSDSCIKSVPMAPMAKGNSDAININAAITMVIVLCLNA